MGVIKACFNEGFPSRGWRKHPSNCEEVNRSNRNPRSYQHLEPLRTEMEGGMDDGPRLPLLLLPTFQPTALLFSFPSIGVLEMLGICGNKAKNIKVRARLIGILHCARAVRLWPA
jgi:hypothetical protein